jgi:glycogen debranching enzyme
MVPNRFPDMGENPEYNSIDASLWFIYAVDRYIAHSQDDTRVRYARYRPRYQGGSMERDSAYHQGTVWPFLLGFFVTARLTLMEEAPRPGSKADRFLRGWSLIYKKLV